MTSRDGELICPQCRTLLNTSDHSCWRCGGTNLQPGPNARKATDDEGLTWPVDANGSPVVPSAFGPVCVCTPYEKCVYHSEKMAGVRTADRMFGVSSPWAKDAMKTLAPEPCPHGVTDAGCVQCMADYRKKSAASSGPCPHGFTGTEIARCLVCNRPQTAPQNIGPSPFGVDPAWVEAIRKGMKMATDGELRNIDCNIAAAQALVSAELWERAWSKNEKKVEWAK